MTDSESKGHKKRLDELEAEAVRVAAVLDKVCAFLRGEQRKGESFASGGLELVLTALQIETMTALHAARLKWKAILADFGIVL